MISKIDAVFEGGGVKGCGLVGAVAATEAAGYRFEHVAGTSAGAIVAALLAVGYTGKELEVVMGNLNYRKFADPYWPSRVPYVGPAASLLLHNGIHRGDWFSGWIRSLLLYKGFETFGDFDVPAYGPASRRRYRLNVIASDISTGELLVLPQDVSKYGLNPDEFPIWKALRMSMSIPYFYSPMKLGESTIVDGAVLSNFPVWLFDTAGTTPAWPTIGYKLVEPGENGPAVIGGPFSLGRAVIDTMMNAHDKLYIEDKDFVRTIPIPTQGVGLTEFDISEEKRALLVEGGRAAAQDFFSKWDFNSYRKQYRSGKEPLSRTERVHLQ